MIGTDEMSSAGMDISESFRPEDISKTDFFDFVTAPDMGIGLGVNVNLHHSHHNHQQHHHHHHHHTQQHHTQQQQQQQPQPALAMTQQQHHHHNSSTHHGSQHQQHQHGSNSDRTMTHDGGGGAGSGGGSGSGGVGGNGASVRTGGDSHNDASGLSDGSSASTTDPTLHGYEFWTTDKEHTSTIFEDLDRYCWQQQSSTTASTNNSSATVMHHSSPANTLSSLHAASTVNPASPHNHHSPATPVNTSTSLTSTPVPQTQLNSDGNISNIISTDGQIYTLTVLNGNEPWLKRDTDAHLNSTLDLDSLLGTFPGYIKSEYPYDDSGFSTDGCKDVTSDTANVLNSTSSGSSGGSGLANNQRLPSLLNNIAGTTRGAGGTVTNTPDNVTTALSIGQQLDQFHNNNNDWHMTDHNNEQNSAESLLRSALQGKGYAKGLHMHNGIALMSTSPTVKDDEMRRILFPVDTDGIHFTDTSLSAAQIFDDTQSANGHNQHLVVPHSPVTNGPLTPVTNNPNTGNNNNNSNQAAANLMVDDMFLTLENAFSDDFEKIKQFCTAGSSANDYAASDVMMQMSANGSSSAQDTTSNTASIQSQTRSHQSMLTSLHIPALATTTTSPNNICRQPTAAGGMSSGLTTLQQQPPPQPLKPEVTTSTQRIVSTTKVTKKYKRTLTTTQHNNNNNNNNNSNNNNSPNAINHNNSNLTNTNKASSNTLAITNGQNRNGNNSSSASSTNSSSSPTHCNGMIVSGGVIGNNTTTTSSTNTSSNTSNSSSSSTTATSAQRKERSLHYCSICSKGFKDKYSVNVHIRTHTGEKPFACTLCGKSFRQKAHLAKHYQTHMAQKNNGSLVKTSAGKHHRSSNSQNLNTSSIVAHNHSRSLSLANTPNTNPTLSSNAVGGLVSGILSSSGLSTLGVPLSTSSDSTTPTTILPPANGLLANR